MEISDSNFGAKVNDLKTNQKVKGEPFGRVVSEAAQAKNLTKKTGDTAETVNQQIIQANFDVSVSTGNEPLSLLLKTAIEGINDVLKQDFGENAIQSAVDSEIDVSPEATAGRIVSLSTAFFPAFLEQEKNKDLSEEEALIAFADIIGGGIVQGFAEAREILDGLGVLEGEIASNIDKTYNLVQEGLKAFVDSYANVENETATEEVIDKEG